MGQAFLMGDQRKVLAVRVGLATAAAPGVPEAYEALLSVIVNVSSTCGPVEGVVGGRKGVGVNAPIVA
jgi:hypothetical protein